MEGAPFFVELLVQYGYVVLALLSLVIQPLVGMAAGLLVRLGAFDLFAVYATLVSVALLSDVFWYWVGYHWGEPFALRYGRYVSISPERIEGMKKLFHRYHAPTLFLSKVVNGLGVAVVVLFTAGLSRVPFWSFLAFNLVGELTFSAIIVGIGYYFGEAYLMVHDVFGRVTLVIVFTLLLVMFVGFSRYVHKRLLSDS